MGPNLVNINKYNPHKQKLFVILVYLWKYKGVLASNFKNQCFKAYSTRKSWPLVSYPVLWLISWVTLIPLDELAENRPIKDRTIVVEKWGCQSVAPLNTITSQSFKTTAMSHFNIVLLLFLFLVNCHIPSFNKCILCCDYIQNILSALWV